MKVYKIQDSKLSKYTLKQAILSARDALYSVAIFFLIIMVFAGFKIPPLGLFVVLSWPVILFLIAVFLFSFFKMGMFGATRYIIDDSSINQIQIDKDVDDVTVFFQNRMARKTGQKRNQFISLSKIKTIKLTKNEITIKSVDYDFMNANGRIKIPCETEGFDEIVRMIRSIADDHKTIEFLDKIIN